MVALRLLVANGLVFVPHLAFATPCIIPQLAQEEEKEEHEQKRAEGSRHAAGPSPRPRSSHACPHGSPDPARLTRLWSDAGLDRSASIDHFRNGLGTPPRC